MTGIEIVVIAAVAGSRSAIKRRREGPGIAEILIKAHVAEQRMHWLEAQAYCELRDLGRRARR